MNLYVGYPVTGVVPAHCAATPWASAGGRTCRACSRRSAARRHALALRIAAGQLVVLVPLALIGRPELYLFLWLAPWMTVWRVINRLRAIAEHGGMTASRPPPHDAPRAPDVAGPVRARAVPHRMAPRPPRRHGGAVAQPPAAARRASWPPGGSSRPRVPELPGTVAGPAVAPGGLDRHRPRRGGSALEVGRQAEVGELLGAEEVVVPDDPAIGHLDHLDGPGLQRSGPRGSSRSRRCRSRRPAAACRPCTRCPRPGTSPRGRRPRRARGRTAASTGRRRRAAGRPARGCRSARTHRRSDEERLVAGVDGGVELLAWSAARVAGPLEALLTEATLVSSSSATSAACHRSTSHRMSTARWRAGSRCRRAATNARRMDSRAALTAAGSPRTSMTFSSATGCTKACSGRVSTAFASATGVAGLISIGRARRCGLRTMSMHTLLAMRYSQERSDDRPSKRSIARQADHRLLDVLGLGSRAQHAIAEPGELTTMGLEGPVEVVAGEGRRRRVAGGFVRGPDGSVGVGRWSHGASLGRGSPERRRGICGSGRSPVGGCTVHGSWYTVAMADDATAATLVAPGPVGRRRCRGRVPRRPTGAVRVVAPQPTRRRGRPVARRRERGDRPCIVLLVPQQRDGLAGLLVRGAVLVARAPRRGRRGDEPTSRAGTVTRARPTTPPR